MRLVVDANIIIAALLKNSTVRKIILAHYFELITISFAKEEISSNITELSKKASMNPTLFHSFLSKLLEHIIILEDAVVKSKKQEAEELMKKIDWSDAPYLALALSVQNDGIWSDDEHFTKQTKVPVFTTKDLVNLLGLWK